MDFYKKEVEEVYEILNSSESGLREIDAKERLEKYGKNKIVEKKKETFFQKFLNQFKDLMVIILVIAAIVAFFLGETIDGSVIIFIVFLNAVIGFVQEYKAEKALEALKKMITPTAVVIREGEKKEVAANELVPGDIIVLEEGARIPADARVIEAINLKTSEAVLTGESTPQIKIIEAIEKHNLPVSDKDNIVFMGTTITHGRGKAIVVRTGMKTEFGKIAGLTAGIKDEISPLKKELFKVGKFIAKSTLVICIFVFLFGLITGHKLFEMFMFAVSLAVAAVPEGLPATVTIALALGVQRMAKKKAIIRKLASVETLGSTTVICSDKTGTLTKNEMTVKEIFVDDKIIIVEGSGYEPKGEFLLNEEKYRSENLNFLLRIASLCNDSTLKKKDDKWKIIGDPTEGALVVAARKAGLDVKSLREDYKRIFEIPFDSTRKMMTTAHEFEGQKIAFIKGAPDEVLKKCSWIKINGEKQSLTQEMTDRLSEENANMAERALRVLGVAYRNCSGMDSFENIEEELIFLGLIGMIDPPRDEVSKAVKLCKRAGIRIFIITGDFGITAKAIAKKVGIADDNTKVITGRELNTLTDHDLKQALKGDVIFARVSPEHKMRIVSNLKEEGEIVAVTGDGVNDAPALKKADIGVAMGITGTDVSKEASDMVLMDDSFATIVSAVKEGRSIYDDITKFMRYIFSSNLGELFAVLLGMLLFPGYLIISAVQILWVDLVTDVLPALALGIDSSAPNIMDRPPRNQKKRIINKKTFIDWLISGFIIGSGVVLIFIWNASNLLKAGTMAFSLLVMYQMVNVFNCRSDTESIFKVGMFSNMKLIGAVLLSVVLQVLVVQVSLLAGIFRTTPLSWGEWLVIIGMALTIFVYDEVKKLFLRIKHKTSI